MKSISLRQRSAVKRFSYYRRNAKRCNQEVRVKRCKPMINEIGGKKAC